MHFNEAKSMQQGVDMNRLISSYPANDGSMKTKVVYLHYGPMKNISATEKQRMNCDLKQRVVASP